VHLLADIGGTHSRFALYNPGGKPERAEILQNDKFPDLQSVCTDYLERHGQTTKIDCAALAVACPVTGDAVELTNLNWRFSQSGLKSHLQLDELLVCNDFEALAYALPFLDDADLTTIRAPAVNAEGVMAVLDPGTGLGVATLIPTSEGWQALPGEGGHVTLAAATDDEAVILKTLRRHHQHVSAERLLSGPGLLNLYAALTDGDSTVSTPKSPPALVAAALSGNDPWAEKTLNLFLGFLGNVAGNLALTVGAQGGIYLGGEILPAILTAITDSPFRQRFEAKGRFQNCLHATPTCVITHPTPAFVGLKAILDR
jgi:glucokinase